MATHAERDNMNEWREKMQFVRRRYEESKQIYGLFDTITAYFHCPECKTPVGSSERQVRKFLATIKEGQIPVCSKCYDKLKDTKNVVCAWWVYDYGPVPTYIFFIIILIGIICAFFVK